MRMTASWFRSHVDRPNTRVWRDDPRPMASSPLIVDARLSPSNLSSSLRAGFDDARARQRGYSVGATKPTGRPCRQCTLRCSQGSQGWKLKLLRQGPERWQCQVESHLGRNRLTSDAPYKASSGFTRVTARWIAQPPKAAFVTRLQPSQLPDQTARQLPEQSTTLRVEPSSTGDTRRRGALGNAGLSKITRDQGSCSCRRSLRLRATTAVGKRCRTSVRTF